MLLNVDRLAGELPSVSLDELDARASLMRRTDVKYVLDDATIAELLRKLAPDHDVLEIDGRRAFEAARYFD
jgi:hypothetical protein